MHSEPLNAAQFCRDSQSPLELRAPRACGFTTHAGNGPYPSDRVDEADAGTRRGTVVNAVAYRILIGDVEGVGLHPNCKDSWTLETRVRGEPPVSQALETQRCRGGAVSCDEEDCTSTAAVHAMHDGESTVRHVETIE